MRWTIYNVEEDHHNPGPHVKEGWSFKLNGKEFEPATTDWSEGDPAHPPMVGTERSATMV